MVLSITEMATTPPLDRKVENVKTKIASGVLAVLLALSGSVLLSAPALALGTVNKNCTHYNTSTGYSSSGAGGFTTNGGVCGESKVRLMYKTYEGSPLYYTGWTYASSTAVRQHPGNIVIGGNHGVADPATLYASAKNYNS